MSDLSQGHDWWLASDGRWYPPGDMAQRHDAPPDAVLVRVGDIACTSTQAITPSGAYPLAGTNWIVTNQTQVSERIPPYAIVLAIIFALACLLGLLFLLIKERQVQGFVQVTVTGEHFYHATQVPVNSPGQVLDVQQRVDYIRSLVAAQGQPR